MQSPKINLRGMTLVEMLVAIFIFTLMTGGLSVLFIQSFRNNAFIIEEGRTAFFNQRAVEQVVSDIRRARQADNGSYPLDTGEDNSIIFYANIDSDSATERVHYFLDGTNLQRGLRNPTVSGSGDVVTYAVGDESVVTVATAVVNTATEPIFTYYNANYPGDMASNPLPTSVAAANTRLVRVHLAMNIDPAHAPDNVNFESFAELRNLNEYTQQ